MFDWAQLTLFLFVSARVSGFILFNPILGRSSIPAMFRTGMVLVLSIFVTSISEQQPPPRQGRWSFWSSCSWRLPSAFCSAWR